MGAAAAMAVACVGLAAVQDFAREAGEARDANRLDEAVGLYQKAVSANPKWTEGWWYLGTLLYDRDDYAGAEPAFAKAAALDAKSGTTWVMLGLCEAKLGRSTEALRHLQQGKSLGIADNPQLRQVMLYTLGAVWLDHGNPGDFEHAQDVLDTLARESVESEDLTVALGLAVLRLRPPPANAELVRAAGHAEYLAAQRRKPDEASVEYKSLADAFPKTPGVQFAYGKFLVANHHDDEAVGAFQRELENTPDHLLARLGIAGIKTSSDPAGGLRYAREAVKLAPKLPEGHYLLGVLLVDTGEVSQGIAQLEVAQQAEPREAKIYFALGRAYARAMRPEDAARARATFVRLNQQ